MGFETINRRIGQRLRHRRRLLGLSQGRVATDCGVCFQQIHQYESGDVTLSAAMLWRLAQMLCVDISYFFDEIGERPGDS